MKEYRMSEPVLLNTLKKIYGSLMAISGKKILVIRDLKIALLLAVRNSVVYVTDDPECAEQFRKNTEAGMGKDDVVILINKWTNKLKFKNQKTDLPCSKVFEKMGMKFDVAIMNPPYDKNLHLKILEAVIPHAEKVINISPVRWLQDPFAPYSTRSDYRKFENTISKKIENLDIIYSKDACKLFDAVFNMNLGIYTCSKNGGYNYKHNDPLITKIIEKTLSNNWAQFSQKKFYDNGCVQIMPYALNVSAYGAENMVVNATYESQLSVELMNEKSVKTGGDGSASSHFEFMTEEERHNFYDTYCHPFMLWYIKYWKCDVHVKSFKVPYFDDYTHPWKLKDFFAWFELTKEEQSRVVKEIHAMRHAKIH